MVDLIGKRNYFFALSLAFIAIGLIIFSIKGFKYDIQFQGGTIMNFQMEDGNFDPSIASKSLSTSLGKTVSAVKTSTNLSSDTVTNMADSKEIAYFLSVSVSSKEYLTSAEQKTVKDAILKDFKVKSGTQTTTNQVLPSIGQELKYKSSIAVVISSILIIFYIWWRFNVMSGFSAGITAVVGLLHDVSVMLSVYLIFQIPLNESFIAAVLTIMGYSMNDTIIIYDRIRENSSLLRKVPVAELANRSVMQTLARSINTVVTVLIAISTVYVFASMSGIESIKEFALPLIIGVASGCYSSIFIAVPLWVMWKERLLKPKAQAV